MARGDRPAALAALAAVGAAFEKPAADPYLARIARRLKAELGR
ncbi:hypothetical protein [Phenylobacterium sp.]|nr:hypothetical protein [Phenylobacterium sp.]